jgi:hypothetical protein
VNELVDLHGPTLLIASTLEKELSVTVGFTVRIGYYFFSPGPPALDSFGVVEISQLGINIATVPVPSQLATGTASFPHRLISIVVFFSSLHFLSL